MGARDGGGSGLPVIGYVRVSTAEQAASGLGLSAQEQTIRRTCDVNGWRLLDVVHDDGASAKDLHRTGLQAALRRLAAGEAGGLVVAKLDRLTRSTVDLLHLLEWSERAGVALVALDLGLDTSTPTGRLVAKIMGSVVEWEREVISARTREAASVRRDRGQRMGRAGVRDSYPEVAERIRSLRGQGLSLRAVAEVLNADGVPTVRGGALWRVSSVQSVGGYVRKPARRKGAALPEVGRRRRSSAA